MTQLTKIGKVATTVKNIDKYTVVTYHRTDVVKFNENEIVLNAGGWYTQTTKSRMNQTSREYGLAYQVFQNNGKWFVDYNGETLDFYSGMTLKRGD